MRWVSAVLTSLALTVSAAAQCALCKAAVQSSGNANLIGGLRAGILLLMVAPYLIVGVIAFAVYRAHRRSLRFQPEQS
ncbi:hypothetical protein HRbin17_00777 [bacterium HR17]|jgi:hypothetical protein|uniref:Uncharacterized protein n=1 Tax=Candidatus Fervidibacter japonicus TaxID=2035412 RepID=A0A2H5XAS9_9BACT|nr:hypothetical protein HRbin17_00777 [bacterium HR17]